MNPTRATNLSVVSAAAATVAAASAAAIALVPANRCVVDTSSFWDGTNYVVVIWHLTNEI